MCVGERRVLVTPPRVVPGNKSKADGAAAQPTSEGQGKAREKGKGKAKGASSEGGEGEAKGKGGDDSAKWFHFDLELTYVVSPPLLIDENN